MRRELRRGGRRALVPPANDNDARAGEQGPRGSILREYAVLLAVLVGVALFYWLSVRFAEWDKIQTCVTMGKRNCTPPIELNRQYRPRFGGSGNAADALAD